MSSRCGHSHPGEPENDESDRSEDAKDRPGQRSSSPTFKEHLPREDPPTSAQTARQVAAKPEKCEPSGLRQRDSRAVVIRTASNQSVATPEYASRRGRRVRLGGLTLESPHLRELRSACRLGSREVAAARRDEARPRPNRLGVDRRERAQG